MSTPLPASSTERQRGLLAGGLRAYHAYGSWLAAISWWHFALLAVLLLVGTAIAQEFPPFSWTVPQWLSARPPAIQPPPVDVPRAPLPASGAAGGLEISIGKDGVRIRRPESPASAAQPGLEIGRDGIEIKVPPEASSEEVRQAIEEARAEIKDAIEEARQAAEEARKEQALVVKAPRPPRRATFGDSLPQLAFLWIVMSAVLKITYKGRLQAEVKAARATETAEAEQLKRQVVEARMAAMQAQVEPHFLFNTLASIDHLIETDPPRASAMQKNLIALLRASMPSMRETQSNGVRELGREVEVIAPYLEILKVRMEDRLTTAIDVPEGLRSAEFPPMMIQGLVENAIKHGLEPKAEGGTLTVKAEIVHGKLAVTVADTGVGFGQAATAGTGIGLANIRERLALLYGGKAVLTVAANPPSGTRVTITVPYVAHTEEARSS